MLEFVLQLKTRNEALFYFGLLCLVTALVFLVLARTTSVQVSNVNAWYKPFKFALSTFLFVGAMAWYCSYLPSFSVRLYNWTTIVLLGFEIVYITVQASRGQLSHFNTSTPFHGFMFSVMALAITLVTIYTTYIGFLFFKHDFPDLPQYYIWAIRFGILLFVAFAFEGFLMGSRMSHTVGGPDGSKGLPIVNWSTKFGDARVAHFVGMHALQVLPLLSCYLL
ncbi:MAG: hypothetical protein SGI87_09930 [Flavobacteriales bacterium]|nr:hypothetical protein [Flavobacteriales bacterium]